MIKSFECYTRCESVTIGANYIPATKWKKRYDDGETASLYVADSGITRAKVREAFEEQESAAPDTRPRMAFCGQYNHRKIT